MTEIIFPDDTIFEFTQVFLQRLQGKPYTIDMNSAARSVKINNPILERLVQRAVQAEVTVLPYRSQDTDAWMILAPSRHSLDSALAKVSHFIIPSYAEFWPGGKFPRLERFDPAKNRLQELGALLFPAGYYGWRSPSSHFAAIIKKLGLWLDLEAKRPSLRIERQPTYQDLYRAFEAALAASNWAEAETMLQDMRRLSVSTAENLLFLEFQLLDQRRDWVRLWAHPEFSRVARLKLPRAVRTAMITAFHSTQLLEMEAQEKWGAVTARVREMQSRLGQLLTGRFGITRPAVIKTFAYQALLDKNRHELVQLRDAGDQSLADFIDVLLVSLPESSSDGVAELSTLARFGAALAERRFDAALSAIATMDSAEQRAVSLVEVAFHSGDEATAQDALLTFWDLPDLVQQQLQMKHRPLSHFLKSLEGLVQPDEPARSTPIQDAAVHTWEDWFKLADQDSSNSLLASSIGHLVQTVDAGKIDLDTAATLDNGLFALINNNNHNTRPYVRTTIHQIAAAVIKDDEFPRDDDIYHNLYETLYVGLLERREANQTTSMMILRLAEALLRRSPQRWGELLPQLKGWFHDPVPVLEQAVLEAFDLLAEYGAQGSALSQWYREWLSYLLSLPTPRSSQSLKVWLSFGQWMQPGADLIGQIHAALTAAAEQEPENPLSTLPDGYRIGIFTLRESSAARARQLLLDQNSSLDIRICTEKDLSPHAQALAENSDMVVVVTTCITHALTYGIQRFLKKPPVYPSSSGSSSILRAVDEYLQQSA